MYSMYNVLVCTVYSASVVVTMRGLSVNQCFFILTSVVKTVATVSARYLTYHIYLPALTTTRGGGCHDDHVGRQWQH